MCLHAWVRNVLCHNLPGCTPYEVQDLVPTLVSVSSTWDPSWCKARGKEHICQKLEGLCSYVMVQVLQQSPVCKEGMGETACSQKR